MRAGQYRHLVTIDATQYYLDTDGGLVASPAVSLAQRFANVRAASGSEVFKFNQMQAEVDHIVELRGICREVTPKMHVVHGLRRFEITAVLHDEHKGKNTVLMCKEMV